MIFLGMARCPCCGAYVARAEKDIGREFVMCPVCVCRPKSEQDTMIARRASRPEPK